MEQLQRTSFLGLFVSPADRYKSKSVQNMKNTSERSYRIVSFSVGIANMPTTGLLSKLTLGP